MGFVAAVEGGVIFHVRSEHIGRPIFATDGTGAQVWEAEYLLFGGVLSSTGPNPDLRFPGQCY